ncbi:16241_t:CDS:2 [Dentiscutata erythropus]|uniref:tyrosinase n=1 Tax=Dentiscutata erythropus TaxID=1348616 RepID=A0A9N9J2D8_9GLOM|nr:16241_t:CDS:2 [Dentiscutata erythropus]
MFSKKVTKLNVFDLKKYKSLPSPEEANEELKKKEPEFNELLEKVMDLTKKRNIELGLRLIHGHDTPLEDGQAMVENFGTFQDKPALITSAAIPNGKTYPASWILSDKKYLVFEYSTDTRVKQVYERLLEDSSALDEISAYIRQYNLDSLVGPCITAREAMTKFNMGQGQILSEHTTMLNEKHVNIVQSRQNKNFLSDSIKTLWGAQINDFVMTVPCYCTPSQHIATISEQSGPVIVKPFDNIELRLPVEVLMSNSTYKKRRDLFLQGFAMVQSRDASDPRSFYAVAGIHGQPYQPYDDDKKSSDWNKSETNRWGGYCHHSDILFPTWHRPYVLLIEMLIYEAASELIKTYPASSETEEYKKELEKLRFPYWDWASPSTLANGVPSILFDEYVYIDYPAQKNVKIRNPLRAFTLPVDLGSLILVGDVSNPTQRPYNPEATTTPYTPKGYSTVRHPDSNYISNQDATSLSVITFCSTIFRPTIYQVLLVDKWRQFSNHGDGLLEPKNENYGHYASIEVIHDAFHDSLGGAGGHMSYPDIAAFDPIFFLHHCNIDRLIAIWQACHPDAWFIKNIKDLGYTYPELEDNPNPPELLRSMLRYYRPNLYLQYHWKLTLTVKKNKVRAPFQIRVFLDLPTANASTPTSSPNFAGLVSIFARGKETLCANCLHNLDSKVVNGSVDLTSCMERLFINTSPIPSGVSDWVIQNIEPSQITLVAVLKDGSGISLEDAGLMTAYYWMFDEGPDFDPDYKNRSKRIMGQVYPSVNKS